MYYVYTDGACSGNDQRKECPGGYGFVILKDEKIITENGGMSHKTTNNRMELTAVIEGLKQVKTIINENKRELTKSECTIITDSKYVCDNFEDYLDGWKKNGWKKSSGKPVLNIDLWKQIDKLSSDFKSIRFEWVKGHASNPFNTRADCIARGRIDSLKSIISKFE